MSAEFSPTTATSEDVVFRFGFEVLGVKLVPSAGVLTELIAAAQVYPIPRTTASLVGLTSLRGTLVPVFDPARASGTATSIRPQQHLVLVFDRDDDRAGVLVNTAPVSVSLMPDEADDAIPDSPLAPFIKRPRAQLNSPKSVWWEFNHRSAFAFFSQYPLPGARKTYPADSVIQSLPHTHI